MVIKKDSVGFYLPKKLNYLLKSEKITYDNKELKTAYLISIISDTLSKFFYHKDDTLDKEVKYNLSSILLKSKYGSDYNHYINYLVSIDFLILVSNYFNGGVNAKARTYKINPTFILNITKCRIKDKVMLKKYSREYLIESHKKYVNSPIPIEIRNRLVNDLYTVNMEIDNSISYISMEKENKTLSYNKYWKNLMSVENIAEGLIFFKFDEYGRMHTNYTVLKKQIRQKYITIAGDEICEIDLENSQPLFLSYLMKTEMMTTDLIKKDVTRYIELVTNGLLYEEIMNKCDIKDRIDAKTMMYKVLFGSNTETKKYNAQFYKLFPNVFKFIKEYKYLNGSYKTVSHKLQSLESDFIFNKVIARIYKDIPDIKLFTVHDSICYPCKYKDKVEPIFNYYKRKIIES